jgi:hypothetical protein|tara:strand:- start:208 stop:906 length:699 start_codon:yes stop_codon:yes gene_type:complete
MRRKKIVVSESELIRSIERIVKEQAAMLGFGNMGGLSLGISKPTDKYLELEEDAQDSNTSDTINVNYMNQQAANQNMEDWEMGEDYELEEGDSFHPHNMAEDSGAFEDNYFNSIKGIRTADVYSESRLERLVRNGLLEAQAKESKKWIQGAVKRPGALRKKVGVKKGDKISLARINQEMRKLKSKDTNKAVPGVQGLTKADLRTYKQLNFAKTLRGMAKKKQAKEAKKWVRK